MGGGAKVGLILMVPFFSFLFECHRPDEVHTIFYNSNEIRVRLKPSLSIASVSVRVRAVDGTVGARRENRAPRVRCVFTEASVVLTGRKKRRSNTFTLFNGAKCSASVVKRAPWHWRWWWVGGCKL